VRFDRALVSAELTYAQPGATRDAVLPAGYAHVQRDVPIGHGREVFERAASALYGWQMHRAAGLRVAASAPRAAPGVLVVMRFGVLIPCRVVYVVDEPDRQGFAYGTLPGHPERGEEAFIVTLTPDGEVRIQIRAFSRAASRLARLGGPVTRLVQRWVTDRYVRRLRYLANL
jgi:uncharacterized protein (UPF0548 family)